MKKLLLFLPLLALTACDLNKHTYRAEYYDGTTFEFKADQCGMYKNKTVVACQSDGQWMYLVHWDDLKHFADLTQDEIDRQAKEQAEYNERQQKEQKNNNGGGDVLGTIIVLKLFGIL